MNGRTRPGAASRPGKTASLPPQKTPAACRGFLLQELLSLRIRLRLDGGQDPESDLDVVLRVVTDRTDLDGVAGEVGGERLVRMESRIDLRELALLARAQNERALEHHGRAV